MLYTLLCNLFQTTLNKFLQKKTPHLVFVAETVSSHFSIFSGGGYDFAASFVTWPCCISGSQAQSAYAEGGPAPTCSLALSRPSAT